MLLLPAPKPMLLLPAPDPNYKISFEWPYGNEADYALRQQERWSKVMASIFGMMSSN